MSQVNMLSIDVTSTPGTIGVKGDSSFGQSNNSSAFADVMAQQQKQESGNNSRQNGKNSAATTDVHPATTAVNKENNPNKAHLVNEEKPGNSDAIGDELADETNNETQVEVQGWPDDPADKKASREINANTNAKLTIADEQSNEISNVGNKKDLTAEELLALLTASDKTSAVAQAKKYLASEKLVHADDANNLAKIEQVKASIAMAQQKTHSSNSAIDESQKSGEKLSVSNDTILEQDKIKVQAEQGKKEINHDTAKDSSTKSELIVKNHVIVNDIKTDEVEGAGLVKSENTRLDPLQLKAPSVDVNTDLKQQKFIGSERALAAQTQTDEKLAVAANSASLETTSNNKQETVQDETAFKNAANSVEQTVNANLKQSGSVISDNKLDLKTSVKANVQQPNIAENIRQSIEEVAVNNTVQQPNLALNEQNSNKQILSNNSATQSASTNSQQSMSQSFEQQAGEQQGKGKESQLSEPDGKNITVNDNKIELAKEATSANTSDKAFNSAFSASSTEDSSTVKPLTASQENAIQQLLSKNSADSITQQAIKNDIKLHDETIAIHRKDFTNAVKEKVMVMINRQIKQLEIRLDPPELGSMQVKLNLQGEQAVVNFVVQNPQAREALEQNINKLKDMLAESGIDVGESNIEQQDNSSTEQNEFSKQQSGAANDSLTGQNEDDFEQSKHNLYKASSTGVDYYA